MQGYSRKHLLCLRRDVIDIAHSPTEDTGEASKKIQFRIEKTCPLALTFTCRIIEPNI
jgi:hypothetical protein